VTCGPDCQTRVSIQELSAQQRSLWLFYNNTPTTHARRFRCQTSAQKPREPRLILATRSRSRGHGWARHWLCVVSDTHLSATQYWPHRGGLGDFRTHSPGSIAAPISRNDPLPLINPTRPTRLGRAHVRRATGWHGDRSQSGPLHRDIAGHHRVGLDRTPRALANSVMPSTRSNTTERPP
jgi:hypothetical protein